MMAWLDLIRRISFSFKMTSNLSGSGSQPIVNTPYRCISRSKCHSHRISAIRMSADESFFVTVGLKHTLLWLITLSIPRFFTFIIILLSTSSTFHLFKGSDCFINLFQTKTNRRVEQIQEPEFEHRQGISDVAISPTGRFLFWFFTILVDLHSYLSNRYIATASDDRTVKIWDLYKVYSIFFSFLDSFIPFIHFPRNPVSRHYVAITVMQFLVILVQLVTF